MNEPKIVSDGHSNEQIHDWLKGKVQHNKLLQSALTEKKNLEQMLIEVELRIEELTVKGAVEILQPIQASTHHPQHQKSLTDRS